MKSGTLFRGISRKCDLFTALVASKYPINKSVNQSIWKRFLTLFHCFPDEFFRVQFFPNNTRFLTDILLTEGRQQPVQAVLAGFVGGSWLIMKGNEI